MRLSPRKVAKALGWSAFGMVLLLGLYLAPFFCPYPMFPHHIERAGLSVYSDREISSDLLPELDEARRRIDAMPLGEEGAAPRIFICSSKRRFAWICRLAGKRRAGQGLLISVAGNAFFSAPTIEAVALRAESRPAHSRMAGSWAGVIAHEAAHHLLYGKLGLRRSRGLPPWKAEGLADYAAHLAAINKDAEHSLRDRVATLLDDERWYGPTAALDRRFFRWQVLTEYLLSIEGLDLSGFLAEETTEPAAWSRMLSWFESGT